MVMNSQTLPVLAEIPFVQVSTEATSTRLRCQIKSRLTGVTLPAGWPASVVFGKRGNVHWMQVEICGQTIFTRRFSAFFDAPSQEELVEGAGGSCPSVLGETVEPDGEDEQGSPSWLVALGLI